MIQINENFIIDKDGKKIGVLLDMESYRKIIDALEEFDEIRSYDNAKNKDKDNESIPFEEAVKEIEKGR